MQPGQELLEQWEARIGCSRRHQRLEIGAEGLVLDAATKLAKSASDACGRPRLTIDERCVVALLSTAYGRPLAAHAVAKMRRAAELWNKGEKALAHIRLAFARLPPCDGEHQMPRLFLAEECFSAGIAPTGLTKAQEFVPALLALLKYDPKQPRVVAAAQAPVVQPLRKFAFRDGCTSASLIGKETPSRETRRP